MIVITTHHLFNYYQINSIEFFSVPLIAFETFDGSSQHTGLNIVLLPLPLLF